MGSVTGYTAERMKQIEDESIVTGAVVGTDLILETRAGVQINAGSVEGPQGDPGPTGTGYLVCTSGTRPTGGALFEGLVIYETDTDRVYVYNGSAWTVPKNHAMGEIGYAQRGSQVTPINNVASLVPDLASTPTLLPDRKTEITVYIPAILSTVAGDVMEISLLDGAAVIETAIFETSTAANGVKGGTLLYRGTLSVGAHPFSVAAQRIVGTGTMSIEATATRRAKLIVKDIGGV